MPECHTEFPNRFSQLTLGPETSCRYCQIWLVYIWCKCYFCYYCNKKLCM